MYVDVRVGKRGEIVIPAFLRKRLNISAGSELLVCENESKLEITPKRNDVVALFRSVAREANFKEKDLVYGDELYEEVFG